MRTRSLTDTRKVVVRVAAYTALLVAGFSLLAYLTALRGENLVLAIESGNAAARGVQLATAGRLRAAAVEYYRFLEIEPRDHRMRATLAELELSRGKYEEALHLAQILCDPVSGDPNPRNFAMLGLASFELGDLDAAERAFREAADRQPANADAMYGLALTAAMSGRLEESRTRFGQLSLADMPRASSLYKEAVANGEELDRRHQADGAEANPPLSRKEYVRLLEWHLRYGRLDQALAIYRDLPVWKNGIEGEPAVDVLRAFDTEAK